MKVRLLKRLHKKAIKKYEVHQTKYGYAVSWKDCTYFGKEDYFSDLNAAKAFALAKAREYILEQVYKLRGSINYNPWK